MGKCSRTRAFLDWIRFRNVELAMQGYSGGEFLKELKNSPIAAHNSLPSYPKAPFSI